jgi:acetylornithine deacetylase
MARGRPGKQAGWRRAAVEAPALPALRRPWYKNGVENDPVELLRALVSIDSVNPDLVPGARGEGEIGRFVADWLRARALEVHVEDTARPGRPNVVAVARGSGGGRSLLLNSHMDTVGVTGMKDPFGSLQSGGRLYGRGAMDTKAALAAFMSAAADAVPLGLPGDLILTAVVDEEYASVGTEAVVKRWKADAAIVGEPTGLEIVTAHKGFAWFEIETRGVAAHGSRPDVGVDAISKMGKVLVEIEQAAARLMKSRPHRILGPGSMHASLIQGGQELSSYPAVCRLGIERRTLPGENLDAIEAELREAIAKIGRTDPAFTATLRRVFTREPLEVPWSEPVVETLKKAVATVTGAAPVLAGMGAWMDSALLSAAGIPTVIFGPRGDGLHGETEWVDLESLAACRNVILEAIRSFCR